MHLIGRGLTDLETLCAVLNMPIPMTQNTYSNHAKALHAAAVDIAKQGCLHVDRIVACSALKHHDGCQAIITSCLAQGKIFCMTLWALKTRYCSAKVRNINQSVTFGNLKSIFKVQRLQSFFKSREVQVLVDQIC